MRSLTPASTAIDYVQEHILGEGPQDNESAIEQRKDEMISDCMLLPVRTEKAC